jgi:uncharacterized membrane protein (DUF2068 family)
VIATSSLLPFEIGVLLRQVRVGRLLLLMLNVAIVVYLVKRALQERRHGAGAPCLASSSPSTSGLTKSPR